MSTASPTFDLVIAANRLPVDRVVGPDGEATWRRSPGGLVTAMESVMRGPRGRLGRLGRRARRRRPSRSSRTTCTCAGAAVRGRGRGVLRGLQQRHPVADLPRRHRPGDVPPGAGGTPTATSTAGSPRRSPRSSRPAAPCGCTTTSCSWCRRWCASCARTCGSAGSTTSPSRRSSCSPSCPGDAPLVEGLLGADFLGFQRTADAENFLRACRRLLGHDHQGRHRRRSPRTARARRSARSGRAPSRSRWTSGAWTSWPAPRGHRPGRRDPRVAGQPASPHARASTGSTTPRASGTGSRPTRSCCTTRRSRRRTRCWCRSRRRAASGSTPTASCARRSRRTVGRINGEYSDIGSPAVHYLHHGYGREEMAALFLAADVMLVTPAARRHEPRRQGVRRLPHRPRRRAGPVRVRRRLARAAPVLRLQPARHRRASSRRSCTRINTPAPERRRRMKALRRRVADHDVQRWAERYLEALEIAPRKPQRQQRQQEQAEQTGAPRGPRQPRRGRPRRPRPVRR